MVEKTTLDTELTEREIEIIRLLADGLSNKEIAQKTILTLYTVKWYLKQIYSKLYVENRTQAATKARELGLLTVASTDAKKVNDIRATRTLPKVTTSFFGREKETTDILALLQAEQPRLITLHGMGGMGKTHLALEVTRRASQYFQDGVYFVGLENLYEDPIVSIAAVLKIPIDNPQQILNELSHVLYKKQCLLLLDNFEHLIEHAPQISTLLQQTHHLRILVTSREILNITSEVVYPLGGLDMGQDATSFKNTGAYQLFLERTQSISPSFTASTKHSTMLMRQICEQIDGMPLAIEMAAGWASMLPLKDIAKRLRKNYELLSTDEQDRPSRQQNIQSLVEYSLNLLSEDVQAVFVKLGVFHREGFTAAGAAIVTGASLKTLKALLDAALIQRAEHELFTMHPLVHQYALEQLKTEPKCYETTQLKYGEFYRQFAVELISEFMDEMSLDAVQRFIKNRNNFGVVWQYALDNGYYDWLEQSTALGYVSDNVGLWHENQAIFKTTLDALPESELILKGRLCALLNLFAYRFNKIEDMRHYAKQSWELLQVSAYAWDGVIALTMLGVAETFLGNAKRGFELLEQVDALQKNIQVPVNQYALCAIQSALPSALIYDGRPAEALPRLKQLVVPDWHEARINLPLCYMELGMLDEAYQLFEGLHLDALDYGNHRLVVITAFYLHIIETKQEHTAQTDFVSSLIEFTNLGISSPLIAKINHYLATRLIQRHHPDWGIHLLHHNIEMLNRLNEQNMMARYILKAARLLLSVDKNTSATLFTALTLDPTIPDGVRTQARIYLHDHNLTTDVPLQHLTSAIVAVNTSLG